MASVCAIVDGESKVVFAQLGSYIANESTGQRMPVSQRQGVRKRVAFQESGGTNDVQTTSPHVRISTLFFSVRTLHVITRVAQDILRASKVSLSSVMSLLNIPSTPFTPYFLFTCLFTDATDYLTDAADWNQMKPLCKFARGWTAWPSGRSDPKHRL